MKCYQTEKSNFMFFVLLLFLSWVCVLQRRFEVCCSWLIMAELQSPCDSGCAPKLWKHPEREPMSPAPVLPTVRVQYIPDGDDPVWCGDPHDLIIAFQSRPSSRGVQAWSNLRTSEWRGSGMWTCGRSGNQCRSLPIPSSQGRNGCVQGTGGDYHRG